MNVKSQFRQEIPKLTNLLFFPLVAPTSIFFVQQSKGNTKLYGVQAELVGVGQTKANSQSGAAALQKQTKRSLWFPIYLCQSSFYVFTSYQKELCVCIFTLSNCKRQNSHVKIWMTFALCNLILLKALTKYEGPNVCWDARFFAAVFAPGSLFKLKGRLQKISIPTNVWSFLF